MKVILSMPEREEILSKYHVLHKLVSPVMQRVNIERMEKAFLFIVEAYKGKRRGSGEHCIDHSIEVASVIAENFGPEIGISTIICALLHDMIVEAKVSGETIKREFGTEIAEVVVGLTRLAKLSSLELGKRIECFEDALSSCTSGRISLILIRIAKSLHDMRVLASQPESEQLQLIDEVKNIDIPLAHMLGLQQIQLELDDLYFRLTHRQTYDGIASWIRAIKSTKEGFLERFIAPIHETLEQKGFHFTIKGRTKSIASIWHKMSTQLLPMEEIHDLYAVRIVFESESAKEYNNCWQIYEIVTMNYAPRLDRIRNWLEEPKSSGYEALHTTVKSPTGHWVEVQIRTKRMDHNAEHGNAAHWRYKDQDITSNRSSLNKWIGETTNFLKQQRKDDKVINITTDSMYVDSQVDSAE